MVKGRMLRMIAKLVLVPVNLGSRGAKALAAKLSEKVGHKVWRVKAERVKKRKAFVFRAGLDKLTQFKKFHEAQVSAPEYTTDRATAIKWLADGPVVARTILRGSEGRGIVIAENEEQLVNAPLYTRYIKKKKEFRVHVFNGQVIDVQEKRKKKEFNEEQRDTRVRNVHNGYVFCRDGIVEPDALRGLALSAVASLGYSLGAVDVVFNERSGKLFVLEVNAAPGMEGTTLEKYSNAIVNWYKEQA
jgi:glutathione synthase/RimK-type ligase-like ATP-grasp enzyme